MVDTLVDPASFHASTARYTMIAPQLRQSAWLARLELAIPAVFLRCSDGRGMRCTKVEDDIHSHAVCQTGVDYCHGPSTGG